LESGRLSASESLKLIFSACPSKIEPHASFLFISLAPQLINDESSQCRKSVASTLSNLLRVIPHGSAENLIKSTMTWYQTVDNPTHNQLASHLLTIFVETLGVKVVKPHLKTIVDLLPSHINGTDHLSIQALNLLARMIKDVDQSLLTPSSHLLTLTWKAVHSSLLHSHSWVRLLAAQLIGLFLANTDAEDIKKNITSELGDSWLNCFDTFKSLILDCMEQLSLNLEPDSELGTQVVKNLVALVKVTLIEEWDSLASEKDSKISFAWILKKSVKIANHELVSTPNVSTKRILVFNLIAASCLESSKNTIESVLGTILPPLHRNLSSNSPDQGLRNHCQEVIDLIKSKVDNEVFSQVYMEIQMNLTKQKGERAATKKQNLVLNPKLAAKRKIQQSEAKRKAKKAKLRR